MSTRSPAPSEATLARMRVVLSEPAGPGNVGASARALKAMGLTRLVLVNPRQFPDPRATDMAVGAADVLSAAHVCDTLDQALAGATLTIALTARRRDLGPPSIDLREAAALAADEAGAGGEVAFVLGTEVSGLSNEDLIRCRLAAHISSDPEFSSLNLAGAVQVVAYEVRYAAVGPAAITSGRVPAATHEETEGLYSHLEASLARSGFLDPANPRRLMERLRRIFGRTRLDSQEVNVLRGMLAAWDEALRGGGKRR